MRTADNGPARLLLPRYFRVRGLHASLVAAFVFSAGFSLSVQAHTISDIKTNLDFPELQKTEYQLTDISDDGYIELFGSNGEIREDLLLPQ